MATESKFSARRTTALVVVLLLTMSGGLLGQNKKPTELVVAGYQNLMANGELLTPSGWRKATKYFEHVGPYPTDERIHLRSTDGPMWENRLSGIHAEVQTMAGDYGTIDASLRLKSSGEVPTMFVFSLVFSNEQWKITGEPRERWATIDAAIAYITRIRGRSTDPVVKRNGYQTLLTLRRLKRSCGPARAC